MSTWFSIYSWSMAMLYPVVNCALCVAAVLAARNPAFRRDFCFLAVAAALSAFCALITLQLRLHLAFHFFSLTIGIRRALLFLHDFAEVASIVVYCIGFFALARHVTALSRSSTVP